MKEKIMLVEDDATMLSLLQTLLEIEGYQVVAVEEFSKLLSKVTEEMPKAILMDVHLKDLDGIEFLRSIREVSALDKISIIMSSGMNLRDRCLDNGANAFLMKPYMPDELIRLIKKLVK